MAWSKEAAYLPVWGDLEWISSRADSFENYKGRFTVPNSQTSPGSPLAGGKDWYWFDYGNTRFITLPEPWAGAWSAWNTTAADIMAQAQADPNSGIDPPIHLAIIVARLPLRACWIH